MSSPITPPLEAEDDLRRFRLAPNLPIYMIGSFDTGITVYSQQVRALNLAWDLIRSETLVTDPGSLPGQKIAIVGGGFAGLTLAAALVQKKVPASITLFERRDTVLPLQRGCDSRWLHPHIYDWPRAGSESYSAALPVMNWTAGRASDVVVEVLESWRDVMKGRSLSQDVRIFCNTQHLQVSTDSVKPRRLLYEPRTRRRNNPGRVDIEWVGYPRSAVDPSVSITPRAQRAVGGQEHFDHVILAVGFGLEKGLDPGDADGSLSYWRNESLAQPHLGQARTTYIVSGSGDGALIDLFRLRIANFRQDRILSELFSEHSTLVQRLREVAALDSPDNTYDILDKIWSNRDMRDQVKNVLSNLRNRLRNDTTVYLHLRRPSFTRIFAETKTSFQNRLLAFLLYKSGGFYPSNIDIDNLAAEHAVPPDRIIVRHGTNKLTAIRSVLSENLHPALEFAAKSNIHRQPDSIRWTGGYFSEPCRSENVTQDRLKANWRKEYLPSPVESISSAFCSAVAGYLSLDHPPDKRLRVALHRRLVVGGEVVLQQCCEYSGLNIDFSESTAGRTFLADTGTIGIAFCHSRTVRTKRQVSKRNLRSDMQKLDVALTSRSMSLSVHSIAAIPLISVNAEVETSRVLAVLYMDSDVADYLSSNQRIRTVAAMAATFAESLQRADRTQAGRLANTYFWGEEGTPTLSGPAATTTERDWSTLEFATDAAQCSSDIRQFNMDFSDFEPVE
ncbi:FAD-dependent oxidoreductase [Mycobacterium sp. NPDC050441]|uniref:FAD-dependent oxidoreductase n=1 Tax=Mycobacterium sp. NPDC050441 TaxID=3155403 RepID=UPI003403A8D5